MSLSGGNILPVRWFIERSEHALIAAKSPHASFIFNFALTLLMTCN